MPEWSKIDFQQFINEFGINFVLDKAPRILYSKKDKEKEDYGSLIAFFFVASGLLIYISSSQKIGNRTGISLKDEGRRMKYIIDLSIKLSDNAVLLSSGSNAHSPVDYN